ncbi:hypothetical protein Scep_015721 [Stephania cephalantha]|uniref:Uncharacterized protein n=1 Tax=Stephania cephalantha TaxID=152367 RepID=A0AAP0J4H4_9MAGN
MYFQDMKKVYKIQPKIEHYGGMVDVLGRSKRLNEALDPIESMPMEPNSVILGSFVQYLQDMQLRETSGIRTLNPGYYVLRNGKK